MLTRALATSLLFGLLATCPPACAQTPPDTDDAIRRCLDEGGTWQSATMLVASCVRPTTDAGRRCTDDAQCPGLCVPGDDAYGAPGCSTDFGALVCSERRRLLAQDGDSLQGVCAATRRDVQPTNCKPHIVDGRLVIEACAD